MKGLENILQELEGNYLLLGLYIVRMPCKLHFQLMARCVVPSIDAIRDAIRLCDF